MKNIWEEEPVVCFTSDIDWASEDMIKNLSTFGSKIFENYNF